VKRKANSFFQKKIWVNQLKNVLYFIVVQYVFSL